MASRSDFWVRTLNQTSFFLLSFFGVFYTSQYVTAWVAKNYLFEPVLYKAYIHFRGPDYARWTYDAVTRTFLSSLAVIGLLGGLLLLYQSSIGSHKRNARQFYYWLLLACLVGSLGSLVSGILASRGVGHGIRFLVESRGMQLFAIAMPALAGFVLGSWRIGIQMLRQFYNRHQLEEDAQGRDFILSGLLLPGLLGTALLSLYLFVGTRMREIPWQNLLTMLFPLLGLLVMAVTFFRTRSQLLEHESLRRKERSGVVNRRISFETAVVPARLTWAATILVYLLGQWLLGSGWVL